MKIKTFRGKTMAETLDQVKRSFGPGAMILTTRSLPRRGIFGVKSKPWIEITAAPARANLPRPLRRGKVIARHESTDEVNGATESVVRASSSETRRGASDNEVLAEIGALKSLVHDLAREARRPQKRQIPKTLYETYLAMTRNEVAEQVAQQLVTEARAELPADRLADVDKVRAFLRSRVEAMLPTAGPIAVRDDGQPTVVALVGPTGVGKTTTIAKLAANFCLREQRRVGLITIDTYRIAAVEQLKTYAQIIDVPLKVVTSPDELRSAVTEMADRNVIFIDTAGRSQRDAIKVKELKGYFAAVRPSEVHLVLAGTSSATVLAQAAERFSEIGIDRVIFTKLDEAVGFGVILSCLDKVEAKLSYVTTGQDVPNDIMVSKGRDLARRILADTTCEEKPSLAGV
jgi:flagellar biosynthesis protein FlhF